MPSNPSLMKNPWDNLPSIPPKSNIIKRIIGVWLKRAFGDFSPLQIQFKILNLSFLELGFWSGIDRGKDLGDRSNIEADHLKKRESKGCFCFIKINL